MKWEDTLNGGRILYSDNVPIAVVGRSGKTIIYLDTYVYDDFQLDAEPVELWYDSQAEAVEDVMRAVS